MGYTFGMARKDEDAIDELKDKLYSRTSKAGVPSDVRAPLSHEETDVPHVWVEPEMEISLPESTPPQPAIAALMNRPKNKLSFAAKFLLGALLFFLIAAGASVYLFFTGTNTISPNNIDIQLIAPSLIDGGKATTIQVIINNGNSSALTLTDLIVDYPDGTHRVDDITQTLKHERQTIGTIPAGSQLKRTLNAVFYGQQGTQEQVKVILEYSVEGSNALFHKEASVTLMIGSSPVSVLVKAPEEVISNQPFEIDVVVEANGTEPVADVMLQAQYPSGFSLSGATPAATAGGTLWRLGVLTPGQPATIHLSGVLEGQDGDERIFRFLSGSSEDPTDVRVAVPFVTVPATLTVHRPFIAATLALNGRTGTVPVAPGGTVQGSISWQNNLTTSVSNLQLVLTLSGVALDPTSVASLGGFYQSSNATITWDAQNTPELASVPAGASGTLDFSFSTLSSTSGSPNINPSVNMRLAVSGTRTDQSGAPDTVSSAGVAQAIVDSMVAFTASTLHSVGPFQNSGPVPPVAGQNTAYTVQWTVTNSSNSVANGRISATIPSYMSYVAAQPGSGITYDPTTRTVLWPLGEIKPGVGYAGVPARAAAFQVILSPSISQVGTAPKLTSDAFFSGQDRYTKTALRITVPAVTTKLDESGSPDGSGLVKAN